MSRIDTRPIKFTTLTVRVPSTGVVRVPDGGYPHEFASIPNGWRELATASKYVVVPILTRPDYAGMLWRALGGSPVPDASASTTGTDTDRLTQ